MNCASTRPTIVQVHVTKLYRNAGLRGGSSHSGRRTFASRVLEQTGEIEVVRNLLGHDDISCTERYLDVRPATLEAMFADAV
ncbi:tyrosine-type recombinase/integrase [Curvibacter sp. APW13]|uniref:tyrosine-type recombinase/integrase n=1 Tax=Curvibacter sp. APW13 TaxID=3077236 RepID=UPI0028E051E2|nr:tyrosine-type recombinase/integrase [Curvibacter sp. APW13]MDT8992713.1 tyrosine-type recombinase/integrase [Curvibacter sp. APW13]